MVLKEVSGNIQVLKLRVILLLEANFNTLNKIIFNTRVMPMLEKTKVILHKIIREYRGYISLYIAVNKKLVSDIAN